MKQQPLGQGRHPPLILIGLLDSAPPVKLIPDEARGCSDITGWPFIALTLVDEERAFVEV